MKDFFTEIVIPDLPCTAWCSGLDPESSFFDWIPAGVYPVPDTGRE
jgi:hypothetical protein